MKKWIAFTLGIVTGVSFTLLLILNFQKKYLDNVDLSFLDTRNDDWSYQEYLSSVSPESRVGGPMVLEHIKNANRVEVFRVKEEFEFNEKNIENDHQSFRSKGLRILRGPESLALNDWYELAKAFEKKVNYYPPSLCTFNPDLLFRIHQYEVYIEMLYCFSCDEFRINQTNGYSSMSVDFSQLIIEKVKYLFPRDEYLQSKINEIRKNNTNDDHYLWLGVVYILF